MLAFKKLLFASLVAMAQFSGVFGQAVRIMALGDSITGNPGCWRAYLDRDLRSSGYTNIDFVGTLAGHGCGFPYDGENEGHGGFLGTNIADQNLLVGWLAQTKPDVVMVHLGTNDMWNNRSPATMTAAFSKLVDQMRASNPNMKILIAQIIPMTPANCADCNNRVIALNSAIVTWAPTKSTANSPITVVDQFTGFVTSTDTGDGVHPNDNGNKKIAARWLAPLKAAIDAASGKGASTTAPVPVPTSTPVSTTPIPTPTSKTPTPTPTPTGPAAGAWAQCGGINHNGPSTCISGYSCKFVNDWYSQCVPSN